MHSLKAQSHFEYVHMWRAHSFLVVNKVGKPDHMLHFPGKEANMTASSLFKEQTSSFSCWGRQLNSPEQYIPEKEMKGTCMHLLRDSTHWWQVPINGHRMDSPPATLTSPIHQDISTEFRLGSNYLFTDHLTTAKPSTSDRSPGCLTSSRGKVHLHHWGHQPKSILPAIKFLKVIGTAGKSLLLFQVWLSRLTGTKHKWRLK